MNTTTQTTTTANSVSLNRTRLVVLFVLLLLSSLGMFGQNTNSVVATTSITFQTAVASNDTTVTATTTATTTEADANMNIVSWFMGSKQTPKATISSDDNNFSRKQIINSGAAVNRLLSKAFLKKAANFQSTLA
ncbi:hypothetical protein [Flavobacterium sp.]|uniref:hypothetical protein n=1 Tax=Flavobacterium sp. TaxID=239 RepID=UPI0026011E9A|nr:hypothetical protein [Flavobacterium sp.]